MENQPDKEKVGSVDQERIEQFKADVHMLLNTRPRLNRKKIAEKMGMKNTNFSNYLHDKLPITDNFLAKFYEAWGEELEKRKKEYNLDATPSYKYKVKDPIQRTGFKVNYKDKYLAMLEKNNDGLLKHLEKIDNHLTRADENTTKLVNGIYKLLENQQTPQATDLPGLAEVKGKDGKS